MSDHVDPGNEQAVSAETSAGKEKPRRRSGGITGAVILAFLILGAIPRLVTGSQHVVAHAEQRLGSAGRFVPVRQFYRNLMTPARSSSSGAPSSEGVDGWRNSLYTVAHGTSHGPSDPFSFSRLHDPGDELLAFRLTWDQASYPSRAIMILAVLIALIILILLYDSDFPVFSAFGIFILSIAVAVAVFAASFIAWFLIVIAVVILFVLYHLLASFSALVICRNVYEARENHWVDLGRETAINKWPWITRLGSRMRESLKKIRSASAGRPAS